ncbi:MAG: serine/threonine protein kinase [Gemmataceae bacterium]
MLIGQKLGPFAIEKELGSGAMGTVYRAKYAKTGQAVAVKVMMPGLGTNERSVARFEREANILKQLRHPNIVRLFGAGRFHGSPYYAMEYLQGESLDHVMARRGRLPWEEVVRIGIQLCDALFHAHQQGIVHRDLKPSNLMILKDGTVKLTDFGIAKDLDVTQLTSANCTVGTASYMSPEQCRGEKDLTQKSDLYSMGVMFYELLVGRKPFHAESAMDMFMQHVQGTFERPARLVMDIPVWLDNLVCQLLEKKPEQRPRDAATVGEALSGIAEKVQAQKSAGADVAKQRFADRMPGGAKPDVADKEMAQLLLNGKFKVKRRKKIKPFFERKWVQATGISAMLLAVSGLIYLAMRPPSEEKLFLQVKSVMEARTGDKDNDLKNMLELREKNGALTLYRRHYSNDPQARHRDQIEKWNEEVIALDQEDQLRRKMTRKLGDKEMQPGEELAWKALRYEDFGDIPSAVETWDSLMGQKQEKGLGNSLLIFAAVKRQELARKRDTDWQDANARRLEMVAKKVKEVETLKEQGETKKAKLLANELKDLYDNHPFEELSQLVKSIESTDSNKP